ncbi:MAG: IclR family acetate operon transcriptional repressor [Gammaproteobacteria bacterium]|jgi:IclR family acetate operon transcriptional repressor
MKPNGKRTSSKRNLEVLGAIVEEPNAATAIHLSNTLDIPLPTIYRQLEGLTESKFITLSPTGTYVPGSRLRSLLLNSLTFEPQVTLRRTILKRLASDLDETVSLSVPTGDNLTYYDRFESHWPIQNNVRIGDQLPLNCSASGKLYLSTFERNAAIEVFKSIRTSRRAKNQITTQKAFSIELDNIQTRGYAFDNEEWFDGMIGASVPIYNQNGDLCSCLSTHSLTSRKSMDNLEAKISVMKIAATKLERILFRTEDE